MLDQSLKWLQSSGWWGDSTAGAAPWVFALICAASQVFLLPITPFAVLGGFLFGFSEGLAVLLGAKMLAATLNFGLARSIARVPALWLTRRLPFFEDFNQLLDQEGFRMALMLRFCPIPFALASYGYGLTRLAFRPYLVATLFGVLFPSVLFVGIGASASDGFEVLSGNGGPTGGWNRVLPCVGIAASLLVTRRIKIQASKRLAAARSAGAEPPPSQAPLLFEESSPGRALSDLLPKSVPDPTGDPIPTGHPPPTLRAAN